MEELKTIMQKFVASDWKLIALLFWTSSSFKSRTDLQTFYPMQYREKVPIWLWD